MLDVEGKVNASPTLNFNFQWVTEHKSVCSCGRWLQGSREGTLLVARKERYVEEESHAMTCVRQALTHDPLPGAHVTAIARSENDLDKLKVDMDAVRVHEDQVISIQRLDLTNSDEVSAKDISASQKEYVANQHTFD